MIARLPLHDRRGVVIAQAVIDSSDEGWARQWRWSLNTNGYVWRSIEGGKRHVYLHRAIAGAESGDGLYVDHINRDRLDCRRSNLRFVTPSESAQNKPPLRGRYRGVCYDRARGRWKASAQLNKRTFFLGRFATEESAAAAVEAWRRDHMPFSSEADTEGLRRDD